VPPLGLPELLIAAVVKSHRRHALAALIVFALPLRDGTIALEAKAVNEP
jgi:hypothetical protein